MIARRFGKQDEDTKPFGVQKLILLKQAHYSQSTMSLGRVRQRCGGLFHSSLSVELVEAEGHVMVTKSAEFSGTIEVSYIHVKSEVKLENIMPKAAS